MKELRSSDPLQPSGVLEHKRFVDARQSDSKSSSPAGSLRRAPNRRPFLDPSHPSTSTSPSTNGSAMVSSLSSPNFRRDPSMRSLKNYHHLMNDMQGKSPQFDDYLINKHLENYRGCRVLHTEEIIIKNLSIN